MDEVERLAIETIDVIQTRGVSLTDSCAVYANGCEHEWAAAISGLPGAAAVLRGSTQTHPGAATRALLWAR